MNKLFEERHKRKRGQSQKSISHANCERLAFKQFKYFLSFAYANALFGKHVVVLAKQTLQN